MGFRNPLTTISADDVTPGTLVGSSVETNAAGKRVRLTTAPTNRVELYTGDPAEDTPGVLNADLMAFSADPADDQAFLWLQAPSLHPGDGPRITLWDRPRGGPFVEDFIELIAGWVHIVGNLTARRVQVGGPLVVAGLEPHLARGSLGVNSGALANGATIATIVFPATPTGTRVDWAANGHAGYGNVPGSLHMDTLTAPACVVVSSSNPQTMPVGQGGSSTAWISVAEGGAFLIPAETAVTLTFRANVQTAAHEYWRANIAWQRTYDPGA